MRSPLAMRSLFDARRVVRLLTGRGSEQTQAPRLTRLTGESGVPILRHACRDVLDVGCGNDSAIDPLGLSDGGVRVAVDLDRAALAALPRSPDQHVHRVVADGEALPFRAGCFGLVITRVALPYMNIPIALREVGRVLRSDGEVWMTLHPVRMAVMRILSDLKPLRLKDALYQTYAILNGLALHRGGRLFRFPLNRRRMESVQTLRGVVRALSAAGFRNIEHERLSRGAGYQEADRQYGKLFVVAARNGGR